MVTPTTTTPTTTIDLLHAAFGVCISNGRLSVRISTNSGHIDLSCDGDPPVTQQRLERLADAINLAQHLLTNGTRHPR
jgi:hypothetical protein